MGPCVAVEGATTGAVFEAYLGDVLAPSLRAGQVVVMDNLSSHKGSRVRKLIEERGCELCYLPPYSPDLNPIEQAFAKLKASLRRAEARTFGALWWRRWAGRWTRSPNGTPRASFGTAATAPRPNSYDRRSRDRA